MNFYGKRGSALLLVLCMMLGMTACGSRTQTGGTLSDGGTTTATSDSTTTADSESTTDATTTEVSVEEYQMGVQNGGTYTNEFLGIGCTLDDSWTYYSEEEIRQINGWTAEQIDDEELAALIEKNANITDMFATNNAGGSINVVVENLGLVYGSVLDEEAYIDATLSALESSMAAAGYVNVSCAKTTAALGSKECAGIALQADFNGVTVYEEVLCIKKGRHMGIVTLGNIDKDALTQMKATFFTV